MREAFKWAATIGIAAPFCAYLPPAGAATLPIPCIGGACGVSSFVTAGQATAVQAGATLTVNQTSTNATLNWQSFNISSDGKVQFIQPAGTSVALNRIYQSDPSQIQGALSANGRIFLINQNGIVFGPGAQVNVGGLLASTLDINKSAVSSGLTAPGSFGQAAFQAFSNGLASGDITIEQGATVSTAQGGQVLIFAPNIANQGTISTPGGQTLMAAGSQIYLASSTDPNLRGLLVEVGGNGGTLTNGVAANGAAVSPDRLVGQILAADGNVTLAGLAVNQLGRVSATTSINENGSIRLQAGDQGTIQGSQSIGGVNTLVPGEGGALTLGAHSSTEVTLDTADPSTTIDANAQLKSDINLAGDSIQILDGAALRATSGMIELTAQQSAGSTLSASQTDGSRIYVAPGAVLDVSGASTTLPVTANVISAQLRGAELANSPLQQSGALRGQTVYVDIREHGTRADGSTWQGTPLADISGEIAAIGHNVVERNLSGGTIALRSHGDVILAQGSTLDLAGGQIQYTGGVIDTTKLVTAGGQTVDIGSANPNVFYTGIANTTTANDPKWGTSSTSNVAGGTYVPGYVEGKDAGTLQISAPAFVFDAGVKASTAAGVYQRLPDQTTPAGALYRGYDQVPAAASLTIGTPGSDFVVGNVTISPLEVLPTLLNADGSPFDPLANPLPASYDASVLRPSLIGGAQGFGNVTIYANGKFMEPGGAALSLPAGGSFSVTANVIDIAGSIDAPGGTIAALAEPTAVATSASDVALTLGPQASLSARGTWVNDNPLLYPAGNDAPLFVDGGSVSLQALSANQQFASDLSLAPGSLIDVSGGTQLSANGKLNVGAGGKIQIDAGTKAGTLAGSPARLELGATLRAYGIYHGGSLSIAASGVCIANSDCSGGDTTLTWLAPGFFKTGGFGSYSITADQGGMSVAPNTVVTLEQQNLQLPGGYQTLADAATLEGLAPTTTLIDRLRAPVSLALTQDYPATELQQATGTNTLTTNASIPSFVVGAGAQILGDPNATISLASNIRLLMDGTLGAPGGDISLSLLADQEQQVFDPTQAIWIGSQGVIDAAGTSQIYVDSAGQRTGTVFAGGSVNLTASRGYIEILPGSLIDVAGASGTIDIAAAGSGVAKAEQVGSAAGSISLTAAEGVAIGGTLEAAAGTSGAGVPQPAGGSFSLNLDPSKRNDYALSNGGISSFPSAARQIDIAATQAPIVVASGYAVPSQFAGQAYVSTDMLASAGFDTISLKAAPLLTSIGADAAAIPGIIDFTGDVTLDAGRLVTLDAASYVVGPQATANIAAPYVELGNSDQIYTPTYVPALLGALNASAGAGSGTLDLSAQFLELYGTSALEGVGSANFTSSADLRLRGLQDLSTQNLSLTNPSAALGGALYMAGALHLTAAQIYPSTLSQFVLSADPASLLNPTTGSIQVSGAAGPNQDLLSAGGALTLSAAVVKQDGVLRAPFGAITIDAQSIDLGAGSITSTSARGLTVPFGTTQGGLDWVYPLAGGLNAIYGVGGAAPPAQRVALQGANVTLEPGAVVDVSGGGDLQAYEWIPGVGGTNDVLSPSYRPDQFAILPSLKANVAPYDPNLSGGTTLQVGDSVFLVGMPGLPTGVYQLLPARYALLPGAYLVSPAAGYQDIQSGQAFTVLGGGTIVAGYRTFAGTPFGDSRTSGFEVVPASVVVQQAQYTTAGANQFFASQAAVAGVAPPALPQDSGLLALSASQALTLDGSLATTPASGGVGAEVDISSANLLISNGAGSPTQPGQIVVSTASLDALGAQTLLLGGLRDGNTITTTAQSVEIASGATLSNPQVLLTAQDQVTLDGGATIAASGAAPASRSYDLLGAGAFLDVSAGPQDTILRGNAVGISGVLSLAAGSMLAAPAGSIYLDATQNVINAGTLSIAGGDLALQAPSVDIGTPTGNAAGAVLGQNVLAAQGLRNLFIESGSAVNFYGSVDAAAQNITIDASSLQGYGSAGDAVTLSAPGTVNLLNSAGAVGSLSGTGTGLLQLNASDVTFVGGSIDASGFGTVLLNAAHAVDATANAGLNVGATGNLGITASRLTTGADVSLSLAAAGAVTLAAPPQVAALPAVADLGGSLAITGASIDVATQIALPSGRVTLATTGGTPANGQLSLASTGSIDVAGLVRNFAGVDAASPGGTVLLTSAGNIDFANGSTIDVSGGSGGAGGSLAVTAAQGTATLGGALVGGGTAAAGASFRIDAQNFGDFGALNELLNTGGFTGTRAVRLRGPGDLVVAAGGTNAIGAHDVSLEADQGGITVNGVIDASGAQGGSVNLAARDNVIVNGSIDAQATSAGGTGGTVVLETASGGLDFSAGATIAVGGGGPAADGSSAGIDGTVLFRAPRANVNAALAGGGQIALAGTVVGSVRTTLEAYAGYQNSSGVVAAADEATMYSDAANFMNGVTAVGLSNLGAATANPTFVLAPGVEIDATTASNGTGTLALDAPWNLYTWRFGVNSAVPGILTLRAQNGITFNASLSDGFAASSGAGAFTLPAQPGDSWSYRIAAGADFAAANPLTVDSAAPADVAIAACQGLQCVIGASDFGGPAYAPIMVRTGDGFIDVSASGNFVLGNQQSLLYTAGFAGPGIAVSDRTLQGLAYPTGGGNIMIDVSGNVVGTPANQFVNAWLWRVASPATNPLTSATAWTVDYQSFQQGIAALGGGDVSVTAGGNINDLSVSIPSIGVQVGGTTQAASVVDVTGGGGLSVSAGGSIGGGSFYAGLGSVALSAGDSIGASTQTGIAPLLALGNASLSAMARDSVALADIVTPTLLDRGAFQGPATRSPLTYFSTYGANSAVNLTAIGGNVLLNFNGAEIAQIGSSFLRGQVTNATNDLAPLDLLPPTLNAYALSGNVDIGRTLALSPSPTGNLQLFADRNVNFQVYGGNIPQVFLSDADPNLLPSIAAPQPTLQAYRDIISALSTPLADQHAAVPVHGAEALSGTMQPVRIVARTGSVVFPAIAQGNPAGIWSAKPVEVVAATDISNLNLVAQNLGNADVTSVAAGRNIVYPQARQANGAIVQDANAIVVDGPGQLQVSAGGNVDLGTSSGISTRANLVNASLPPVGASISVNAGTLAPQYAAFINQYIEGSDVFDPQLIAFVESLDGLSELGARQAKQLFSVLNADVQRVFVESVFFDVLRTNGRAEAASGNGNFTAAFDAIQTLFPGANPNLGQGESNPYSGNIDLYFSRIYTQQGGNISLLAPGGGINVGLALAPSSFGISKSPGELGIVAQTSGDVNAFTYNDFQVNQSRVFAADGGSILVWSTDGNIDAGRGAKTAISAPALNIVYDPNGQPAVTLRAAIAGSGIQALAATPGVSPGNVDLFAPHGIVNANDAGIVAGNLTIAATAVLGANNITVSGTSVGVPVTVTGLGASVAGAAAAVGGAGNVAESGAAAHGQSQSITPAADNAINWLDVFVTGLGEDDCKPDDLECLKRQNGHPDSL